jgi:hypothetical protein
MTEIHLTAFMQYPSEHNTFLVEHVAILNESYRQLLGSDLITGTRSQQEMAGQLFKASFAVVSHNTDPDPIFNYANLSALNLFELNWEEFIQLPSRLSAEPVNQAERERLLTQVARHGYINHYEGVRISKSGQRFLIKNATVWNLTDPSGKYYGQAACFKQWQFL